MAVDIERLQPGIQVRFPDRTEPVTLIAVRPGPFWEFYFDGPSGPGKRVLAESELAGVEVIETMGELRFDGNPVPFRLGVEARRIDIAFVYEMAAVAVSNIQPLPHQLEAVYECFLREPRLRFLLADDPGAGKTIMAGLYMKELILRRAGDRILIMTRHSPVGYLAASFMHIHSLGRQDAWGIRTAANGSSLVDPALFVERLFPDVLTLLNSAMEQTPVERLSHVRLTSTDGQSPLGGRAGQANWYSERNRLSIRWQLGFCAQAGE